MTSHNDTQNRCIPICATPVGWDVTLKPGTVGPPIGPSLRIGHLETGAALPYGEEGEVLVRGPGVMPGYLGRDREQDFVEGEWLRTGDLGRMDKEGFVFLRGRLKEMIKRGGTQISLHEVDEILGDVLRKRYPGNVIQLCLSFPVPNELRFCNVKNMG